jgi:hypothetical protein
MLANISYLPKAIIFYELKNNHFDLFIKDLETSRSMRYTAEFLAAALNVTSNGNLQVTITG